MTDDERPHWLQAFAFVGVRNEVPDARRRIAELAERQGLSGAALFDFMLAVGEALNNAVRHGSPLHEFDEVTVRVGTVGPAVVVEITDKGRGLETSPICPPDVYEVGGRGILAMRALVDDLHFACQAGGTTVVLAKNLPS